MARISPGSGETPVTDAALKRSAPTAKDTLKGILFMLLAVTVMFPIMNTTVKYLQADYPYGQVVFARYAGHMFFVAVFFAWTIGLKVFRTTSFRVQLMRSSLLFACTALYFFSLQHIELATAASIGFSAPIIVTALAAPVLGEKVGIRRYMAVLVGFSGALIIIRPGGETFHWAMILVVGNAVSYALYQLLTRKVSASDSPETSIIYTALIGVILSFVMLPGIGNHLAPGFITDTALVVPNNMWDWALFISMGFLGGFGHYFVGKALGLGEASIITLFGYGQLLGALTLGFFVFSDFPDALTLLGAAIIIGSGLYIAYRESVRRR